MITGSSFGEHGIKEQDIDWVIVRTFKVSPRCACLMHLSLMFGYTSWWLQFSFMYGQDQFFSDL